MDKPMSEPIQWLKVDGKLLAVGDVVLIGKRLAEVVTIETPVIDARGHHRDAIIRYLDDRKEAGHVFHGLSVKNEIVMGGPKLWAARLNRERVAYTPTGWAWRG